MIFCKERKVKGASDQGVYKIIFPDGSWYVGSAINIGYRCKKHRQACTRGNHHNARFQELWNHFQSFEYQRVYLTDDFQEMWDVEEKFINETTEGRINVQTVAHRNNFSRKNFFSRTTLTEIAEV